MVDLDLDLLALPDHSVELLLDEGGSIPEIFEDLHGRDTPLEGLSSEIHPLEEAASVPWTKESFRLPITFDIDNDFLVSDRVHELDGLKKDKREGWKAQSFFRVDR